MGIPPRTEGVPHQIRDYNRHYGERSIRPIGSRSAPLIRWSLLAHPGKPPPTCW